MNDERSRLLYSTDGVIERKAGKAEEPVLSDVSPARQRVRVRLERKGRMGKAVTVIEGLRMPDKDRGLFLKKIKARFGTGGTVKDSALEIQGDRRDMIITTLESMGYRPKRSGG